MHRGMGRFLFLLLAPREHKRVLKNCAASEKRINPFSPDTHKVLVNLTLESIADLTLNCDVVPFFLFQDAKWIPKANWRMAFEVYPVNLNCLHYFFASQRVLKNCAASEKRINPFSPDIHKVLVNLTLESNVRLAEGQRTGSTAEFKTKYS
ncbi:hypothetical protein AVEN_274055-1 [Araneus ventricosus]|uniref:Uncharacterized protein n=1 Tax=Araneus ventricosus TaxID=182803 RepID=A0A4Y2MHY7_ARAVE|nr:hypothetical protein AVEN_274055-1 [Araneus ventricosus]